MANEPESASDTPPSATPEGRAIWVEPEIEMLSIEQTETLSGVGHDGSFHQAPDCTLS